MSADVVLRLRGIQKAFGRTRALQGVDFEVRAGEVHALLGQNGSGKSTLMKIAYGELTPDQGAIEVEGRPAAFHSPHDAARLGISAVSQELELVPGLSASENILLGRLPRRGPAVRWAEVRRRAREVLRELGTDVDPRLPVGRLRIDQRQVVAIARAVATQARVIVFDEPTSSLGSDHVEALFATMRRLRDRGIGMVFISQRLQDVEKVADRITVLRDGLVAGTLPAAEARPEAITRLMIGRSLTDFFGKRPVEPGPAALEVRNLTLRPAFRDVTLTVRQGEIVGIAGLVGCGRAEVLRAIYGARRADAGEVRLLGRPVRFRDPGDAVRAGVALVPGDRKLEGLVLPASVQHNLMLARNHRLRVTPLRGGAERRLTDSLIARLQIRPPSASAPVFTLSGGNQQKVALGRWLAVSCRVLLLDEPARGIDVGARAEIYGVIGELADRGLAVLISSSETPELLGLCDRILVMAQGRVVAALGAAEATEAEIMDHATGARTAAAG
jgi:ABC-type sugar transport system ATPase subunit